MGHLYWVTHFCGTSSAFLCFSFFAPNLHSSKSVPERGIFALQLHRTQTEEIFFYCQDDQRKTTKLQYIWELYWGDFVNIAGLVIQIYSNLPSFCKICLYCRDEKNCPLKIPVLYCLWRHCSLFRSFSSGYSTSNCFYRQTAVWMSVGVEMIMGPQPGAGGE